MFEAQELQFHHSDVNCVSGNQYNTKNIYVSPEHSCYGPSTIEDKTLAMLKPAVRGGYDVPGCLKGTRETVLKDIFAWLKGMSAFPVFKPIVNATKGPDSGSTPNIMWISGSPGAGKSAIASTLVSSLNKLRRLGSFFFFKRGDAILSDPSVLWRTVAYDLAQFHPSIKASVIDFLSRPGFRDAEICLHFECMIEDALTNNHDQLRDFPPVIVLDALDECGSDDLHSAQRRILLDTLARWSLLPRTFKIIVTSRNERLPSSFLDPRVCLRITLETGDSVGHETQSDIRSFFEQSLDNIQPSLGLPSTAVIQLTDRAAGLFIWAKTAISFMEKGWGDPMVKLKLVLVGKLGTMTENIDTLYQHIVDFAFREADDKTIELFKIVIGAIIVSKVPLCRDDLKHFVAWQGDGDEWRVNAILYHLSSVIDADHVLRLRHLSFAEFLSDRNRCREPRFVIDQTEQHQNMALACLRIMNDRLRFNICGLESSHVRNDDVPDLSRRITAFIPPYLSYSCRFWATHLRDALAGATGYGLLLQEIRKLFYVRLLYWLEVMSLVKEVPASSIALRTSARSIEVSITSITLPSTLKTCWYYLYSPSTPSYPILLGMQVASL
jgi:hypothetical protein